MTTQQENNAALHATAEQIASSLDGWRFNGGRGRNADGDLHATAYLTCVSGEFEGFDLRISRMWNLPKFEIGLAIPHEDHKNLYLRNKSPEIGVSSKKTGAKIAADITRRLLTQMSDICTEIRKARADHEAYESGKAATRAAVLKSPYVTSHKGDDSELVLRTKASGYGHEIKVSSDGTVGLTLSDVTPEQAVEIFALLNR